MLAKLIFYFFSLLTQFNLHPLKGLFVGTFLLNFIKSYFIIDNKTGCRFLTVDAYANAVPFYFKNGFIPLNEDDADSDTRLLFFDLATIVDGTN